MYIARDRARLLFATIAPILCVLAGVREVLRALRARRLAFRVRGFWGQSRAVLRLARAVGHVLARPGLLAATAALDVGDAVLLLRPPDGAPDGDPWDAVVDISSDDDDWERVSS